MRNEIKNLIIEELDSNNSLNRDNSDNDYWEYEIYASYDEYFSNEQINEILDSDDLDYAIEDELEDLYYDYVCESHDEIATYILDCVNESYEIDEDEKNEILDYLHDHIAYIYPVDHYENQKVKVDIFVNTGDSNYDYTLNYAYPAWGHGKEEKIDANASLCRLAEWQGYSVDDLRNALMEGDIEPENSIGFLNSVRQEVANESGAINVLTFLVTMSLKDLIQLNKSIRNSTGSIRLDKNTTCGLFDPWNGGGSCFEIEIEKPFTIPVKNISRARPDSDKAFGNHSCYSIEEVYGMYGFAWGEDVIDLKE